VLRTRLWTALIALPAVLAIVVFAPAWLFSTFIAVLTVWGLWEIGAMTNAGVLDALILIVAGGGAAAILLLGGGTPWILPAAVIFSMVILVAQVGLGGGESVGRGRVFVLVGALWVGVLFPYFALLRNRAGGVPIVVLMLLLVVVSDSGAYFVGRWKGRIKLLPRVSPNKTVEGAIGGLAACVAAGIVLRSLLTPQRSLGSIVLLAAGVGVLAQLGDLAGSAFKRVAGVKDSGWIFPGHGGLLDRTCSLVFAAAFAYYCSR
jgi:phosphatidate cytidylyltransferase